MRKLLRLLACLLGADARYLHSARCRQHSDFRQVCVESRHRPTWTLYDCHDSPITWYGETDGQQVCRFTIVHLSLLS